MSINYISDLRERKTTSEVNSSVVINYIVRQETGKPVFEISGAIVKNGERVANTHLSMVSDEMYFTGKFSALTSEERKLTLEKISADFDTILSEPIE